MAALHAKALTAVPELVLAKAVSRDPGKARAFAEAHGAPQAQSFDEFLAAPDVDAIWLVAPAPAMHRVGMRLAATQLPLFLEKPVGMSVAETREALAAIGSPHMVGLNRRFYEVIQAGKAMLDEAGGATGIEIQMPEYTLPLESRYDRSVLDAWHFGNSVHLIDLFRYFGGEVDIVRSMVEQRTWWDQSVAASLRLSSGALGVFHANWGAPGGWRVTVSARDLQVVYQPIEQGRVLRRGQPDATLTPSGPDATFKAGLAGQARAFASMLQTGRLPAGAADLADYARSVQLVADLFQPGGVP
jgi:predicted dehydrogenase